jgi:hypothetical protein
MIKKTVHHAFVHGAMGRHAHMIEIQARIQRIWITSPPKDKYGERNAVKH